MREPKFYSDVASPTARLLNELLAKHPEMKQDELARIANIGKSKGNIITMFKSGRSPLPIKHIIPICKALNEDPKPLLTAALKEYYPVIYDALIHLEGKSVDEEELRIIQLYRVAKERKVANADENAVANKMSTRITDDRSKVNKLLRAMEEVIEVGDITVKTTGLD